MKPFLHDEIFAVHDTVQFTVRNVEDQPVVVIDDLFANFESVRELLRSTPPGNWKHVPGGRNFVDYFDCRISFPLLQLQLVRMQQMVIDRVYAATTKPMNNTLGVNWFKQINPRRADFAFPHTDHGSSQRTWTCLIYANDDTECLGGTAFFRNRETGISKGSLDGFFEANPSAVENGMDYWPEQAYWELLDVVDMRPNRMVVFPADMVHAAYHPQDGFFDEPRLTIVSWFVEVTH
jgi:hypothetical protein